MSTKKGCYIKYQRGGFLGSTLGGSGRKRRYITRRIIRTQCSGEHNNHQHHHHQSKIISKTMIVTLQTLILIPIHQQICSHQMMTMTVVINITQQKSIVNCKKKMNNKMKQKNEYSTDSDDPNERIAMANMWFKMFNSTLKSQLHDKKKSGLRQTKFTTKLKLLNNHTLTND